jgi:uracil phosphoribosyltransferase
LSLRTDRQHGPTTDDPEESESAGEYKPRPAVHQRMSIEDRDHVSVVTHALAQHTLADIRSVETEQVAFRKGLVKLGRICGYELIDGRLDTERVSVETPLTGTTGTRVEGMDDVVIVNVLRAATPFVEGLLKAFPRARQGVISASRDDEAGMDESGQFPIEIQYVKLPEIRREDTVVVADPMLATGSTMCAVLEEVTAGSGTPDTLFVLSAVSAEPGLSRVEQGFPGAELVTVSVDDRLDDDGYIVPGLGDAGDRAFRTS